MQWWRHPKLDCRISRYRVLGQEDHATLAVEEVDRFADLEECGVHALFNKAYCIRNTLSLFWRIYYYIIWERRHLQHKKLCGSNSLLNWILYRRCAEYDLMFLTISISMLLTQWYYIKCYGASLCLVSVTSSVAALLLLNPLVGPGQYVGPVRSEAASNFVLIGQLHVSTT